MESCQKNGRRGDVGTVPGIVQAGDGGAEVKNLIEIASKGRELVVLRILLSHNCKIGTVTSTKAPAPVIYVFRSRLRCCARARRSNSRLISEIFSSCSFNLW